MKEYSKNMGKQIIILTLNCLLILIVGLCHESITGDYI